MSNIFKLKDRLYVQNEFDVVYQDPTARLTDREIELAKKELNIRTDVHRMCVNCQIRQRMKYDGFRQVNSETGEDKIVNEFMVPCNFVPKELSPEMTSAYYDLVGQGVDPERAKKLLMATVDPVVWAELMFGFTDGDETWQLRDYQKEQLRCNAQRYVLREGRRSGKTFIVALKLLFLIFNRKIESRNAEGETIWTGPAIMIVTPFQSQLTNVFNEMEKLLKKNESLASYIMKQGGASLYTKTPNFKMEFSNGGLINGFVTGTGVRGDGAGGGALRGQSAHVIYLDEMDLIEDEVIEKVVMPILLSDLKGEVTLIGTSTPIGKRSFFYNWCLKSPDFKEDHFPSTVLPQWNKIKGMILSKTTREGIMTEYMAEFIDSEYGVFKANYVQRSRRNYTYYDISETSWWMESLGVSPYSSDIIKCIGIDWNKNAGTEFCVVAYIPQRRIYILLDSINVPSSEISGQKWKETVIMLNMKWKPDYIYADEGYGHTIIEDLLYHATALIGKKNKNALDLETIRLRDRLKSFNFSSKVELRNPIDGTVIEKPSKEFLVENTQRIFEDNGSKGSGIVWIPETEEVLIAQMQNYVVQKINKSSGKPVFGPDNEKIGDHRLDAFMLALAGIEIETGLFGSANLIATDPIMLAENKKKEDRLSPLSIINRKQAPEGFTGNTRDIRLINNRGVEFNPKEDKFSERDTSFFKRNLPKTNNRRSF